MSRSMPITCLPWYMYWRIISRPRTIPRCRGIERRMGRYIPNSRPVSSPDASKEKNQYILRLTEGFLDLIMESGLLRYDPSSLFGDVRGAHLAPFGFPPVDGGAAGLEELYLQ